MRGTTSEECGLRSVHLGLGLAQLSSMDSAALPDAAPVARRSHFQLAQCPLGSRRAASEFQNRCTEYRDGERITYAEQLAVRSLGWRAAHRALPWRENNAAAERSAADKPIEIGVMIMRSTLAVAMLAWAFLMLGSSAGYENASPEDDQTLSAVLDWWIKKPWPNGTHIVVSPVTRVRFSPGPADRERDPHLKEVVLKEIHLDGYDLGALVDRLIQRNQKPARIKLASGLAGRFVLDEKNAFTKYFQEKGGGWGKWYDDNPKARGHCVLSLPAVDKERGLVLIYSHFAAGERVGKGTVFLFKQVNGKLDRLGSVVVWTT